MDNLQNLKSNIKKKRKRVGRGNASGHGTYSTKGMKGQTARSGGRRRPGFEGGQTPYLRRMPKYRGFKNPNSVEYQIVNTGQLEIFENGTEVNTELLLAKKLISKKNQPVKLLDGKGKLTRQITVFVEKASNSAIKSIESLKGKVVLPVKKVENA